ALLAHSGRPARAERDHDGLRVDQRLGHLGGHGRAAADHGDPGPGGRLGRVADQGGDLVAVGDGALDEVAADAAGGSQNGDTHVVVPFAGRCLDVFESTAARAREPSPGRAGTYAIVSVRTAPAGVGAGWTRLS